MNAKTILIVDDDQVIANIYQNKFRIEGYESEVAGDGESALEMLRKTPTDLVILDLSLPGMNGLEVLRLIRSRPETQTLPIIVFSNTHLSSMVQAAWKAGATKCLSKANCTPSDVANIVGKVFAAASASKTPGTVPFTIRLPGPPALGGRATLAQSEIEFQTELVGAFLTNAPKTLTALRDCLKNFIKPERENLRLVYLDELCRLTRSLTGAAGVVGFRIIAQMASALEALLKELHARPTDITPSTVRTVAQAIDKLAFLIGGAGTLTGHTAAPESPMVLVVDDEIVSRELIHRAVDKAGLPAISLDNSTLALQVLAQNHFDLVFLDIKMPKPDGIEVYELLRKMPLNRTTPVVFVTSTSEFEIRVQSSLSRGSDFIAKPFPLLELTVKALTWLYNEDLKPLCMAGDANSGQKNQKPLLAPFPAAPSAIHA
jgi:CheY-like chemotaxis protein